MLPVSFGFERYRAFEKPEAITLAPLNIIIGRNGGGKSVITRFPMLLSGALTDYRNAPLALETDGLVHANRFEDLIYQRSAQPFSIAATIADGKDIHIVEAKLRHVVETYSLVVEQFSLITNDTPMLEVVIDDPDQLAMPFPTYRVKLRDEAERKSNISFAGVFPFVVHSDREIDQAIDTVRIKFTRVFTAPAYLGPFRVEASALSRVPRQDIASLGPRGEWALDFLANDLIRQGGELARSVESWFGREMGGSAIQIKSEGQFSRVLVHDPLRGLDVDLSETGAGFGQLFPIVVQAMALRSKMLRSPFAIVEQPELHLHPVAHGAVADLILETVAQRKDDLSYIVETHSEQFISRVRRRVAEGKVPAEHVQILSVGHLSEVGGEIEPLRKITLDSDGNPSAWPVGVFEEAFDDLIEMRRAITERHSENK